MEKIKIFEAVNIYHGVAELKNQKLPIKTAFKINQVIKSTEEVLDFFQAEVRKIISEFQQLEEDGITPKIDNNGNPTVDPARFSEFNERVDELQQQEIDIELKKFSLDEFESMGDIEIKIMNALMPLIENEE